MIFMSKDLRLANATFNMLSKILKNSQIIKYTASMGNERNFELDNCYIAFNTVAGKLTMTPKRDQDSKVTIDCHYDNSKIQQFKYNSFSNLLDFAENKLTKYIEKTTINNFRMAKRAIKASHKVKKLDPKRYNARYELDDCVIDFDSGAGNYVVTIIKKDKSKIEIKWKDAKNLSWRKFYRLLELVQNKEKKYYEENEKRSENKKAMEQLRKIINMGNKSNTK